MENNNFISINIDKLNKLVLIYEPVSFSDITKAVNAIDPENADKYEVVSFEYLEENSDGDITDEQYNEAIEEYFKNKDNTMLQ